MEIKKFSSAYFRQRIVKEANSQELLFAQRNDLFVCEPQIYFVWLESKTKSETLIKLRFDFIIMNIHVKKPLLLLEQFLH